MKVDMMGTALYLKLSEREVSILIEIMHLFKQSQLKFRDPAFNHFCTALINQVAKKVNAGKTYKG